MYKNYNFRKSYNKEKIKNFRLDVSRCYISKIIHQLVCCNTTLNREKELQVCFSANAISRALNKEQLTAKRGVASVDYHGLKK